jgi:hypothetical protein
MRALNPGAGESTPTTVRLRADQVADLRVIAEVEGRAVSEVVREAVDRYLAEL